VIADKVPLFEKTSIDEHYIDMTGMDKFYGCFKFTHELRQRITKETGLPISFGLSENKTVAKVATDQSKPNGELEVINDRIKPFLFPLSVEKLPFVGAKTSYTLKSMGVFTIQGLAEIPIELMKRVFGQNGIIMSERANGIDDNPVIPFTERKSVSEENTFEQDIIDIPRIESNLASMVENLCFILRKENRLTSCITVKLRYANFETCTQQSRIPHTSADHLILPKVLELFRRLYERRMRIRLIGVKFTNLVSGSQQINLFEDSLEMVNLYQAIDRMKKRFGANVLFHASKLNT
jgi:DNA polymerase IV